MLLLMVNNLLDNEETRSTFVLTIAGKACRRSCDRQIGRTAKIRDGCAESGQHSECASVLYIVVMHVYDEPDGGRRIIF